MQIFVKPPAGRSRVLTDFQGFPIACHAPDWNFMFAGARSRGYFCAAIWSCILLYSSGEIQSLAMLLTGTACLQVRVDGVSFVRPSGRAFCFTDPLFIWTFQGGARRSALPGLVDSGYKTDPGEIQSLAMLLTGTSCLQVPVFAH